MATPTYAALRAAGPWRALRHCPGRCVWPGPTDRTPSDLVGGEVPVRVVVSAVAPDPIHVAVIEGGGVISYRKPDGRFVHTLNTTSGFARKLDELGLTAPGRP